MIGGRKIVGSAQLRQGGALLQHGSILLEDNQSFVHGLMRGAMITQSSPPSRESLKKQDAAPRLRSRAVAEAINRAAEARWPGEWNPVPHPEAALRCASSLYPHYRSVAWTWAR